MVMRGLRLIGKWTPDEIRELGKVLSPLPAEWVERNPHVQTIGRESVLADAPPDAPGHSKFEPESGSIVVFDKGVYHGEKIDPNQFRRSIYHELAHTLIRDKPQLLKEWQRSVADDAVVDDYARTGPEEDFADTFSEFFIHPDKTQKIAPKKSQFLRELLAKAQEEKTAMFLYGFTDELTKTAAGLDSIRRMLSRVTGRGAASSAASGAARGAARIPGKMSVGKGLMAAGAAGGAGAIIGMNKGQKKGVEQGMEGMDEGMQKAYQIGVQRGALAMRNAIVQQMQAARRGS